MTTPEGDRLVGRALVALTIISIAAIIGGIIVAFLGSPVGAVIAVATGAVGGIVAIVIRTVERNGGR